MSDETETTETFETVKLIVEVKRRQSDDAIFSSHRPFAPGDQMRMANWPSGGLVHIAHGLYIEALRREAYTMAISVLSTGTPLGELTPELIEERMKAHLIEMADSLSAGAAQEAYEKVKGGMQAQHDKFKEDLSEAEAEAESE